jgi:hypothetical protein
VRWSPVSHLVSAYADESSAYASMTCVNLLPESAEVGGTRSPGMLRDGLPGWYDFAYAGTGPIRGAENVEGKYFVVSGTDFGQIDTQGGFTVLGTVPGTGRVVIAHDQITSGNEILIANGSDGYTYNTVTHTFAKITDDAFPGGKVVVYLGQYLILMDPSGRYWYHSDLAAARDYSSIDRYEAEASPDRIVSLIADHGRLLVFGERTIEEYENQPLGESAFQRTGNVIERGCGSAYSPVLIDNAVFFLGEDGNVYRLDGFTPVRISTYPVEQAIAKCKLSKAFAFKWEDRGHKVYYLTFQDGLTWGYDVATRLWHRRQSYRSDGQDGRWRANTLTQWRGQWYAGDYSSGTIYVLDHSVKTESEFPLVREFSLPIAHDHQNRVIAHGLEVLMDVGQVSATPALRIIGSLPDQEEGIAYSETLTVVGGTAPYSVEVLSGALAAGGTAEISGSALTVAWADDVDIGTYTFVLRVTDDNGDTTTSTQTVEITSTLAIDGVLPVGQEGVAYSETLAITGGIAPYANATLVSGSLPSGGALAIVGSTLTVTAPDTAPAGTYSFVASVDDDNACTAQTTQTLVLAAVDAISYSAVLADIGGTQLRYKCDDASGAMTEAGHPSDTNYDIPRSVISTALASNCYHQTTTSPVWDPYGLRLGSAIGGSTRNYHIGASPSAISALIGMTEGFVAAWVNLSPVLNQGTIWAISHDVSGGAYAMLRRTGTDTIHFYVSTSSANQFRIGKSGLTFGAPMHVVVRKSGSTWSLWINGVDIGATTVANGTGSAAYWLSTISSADKHQLGYLQRGFLIDPLYDDVLYDIAIGSVAPTDQQIADLYAATLP